MDVILIFVVGTVLALLFIVSLIKIIGDRVQAPVVDLQKEMTALKQRVEELERK